MSTAKSMSTAAAAISREHSLRGDDIDLPYPQPGVGTVITTPNSAPLVEGAQVDPVALWPDDRGHFLEVQRIGCGVARHFPPSSTQVSATATYPGVVKAFHYHLRQYDCWTVVKGMLQVALVDLRRQSSTFGMKNTLYVGTLRPWQILIPPGIGHGYKVIGTEPAMLVYVTNRFYNPKDEGRIPHNEPRIGYDWELQHK